MASRQHKWLVAPERQQADSLQINHTSTHLLERPHAMPPWQPHDRPPLAQPLCTKSRVQCESQHSQHALCSDHGADITCL